MTYYVEKRATFTIFATSNRKELRIMNRIITFFLVLSCSVAFGQHTAAVSATSDFHTIQNNVVKSTFTLNSDPTEFELSGFHEWAQGNASLIQVTLEGRTLVTSFSTDYNERNVYTKLFRILGIESLEIMQNGEKVILGKDQFFDHFNL